MDIRDSIIEAFKLVYGFAPRKNQIRPLEGNGKSGVCKWDYEWLAFHINGVGYQYWLVNKKIERAECYDMKARCL